jgi:hypothetical protein
VLFVSSCLTPATAEAQAAPVALDLDACAAPAPGEVRALLALELRERLLPEGAPMPSDALQVEVRCSETEAELLRRDTGLQRTVAVASVPATLRARLLALAIAELTRPVPAAAATAAVPPPAPTPAPPVPPPPARAARRARYALWAGLEGQATPLLGLGGSLLLRVRVRQWFGWSSALSFGQTRTEIDRGELRVRGTSLRSGPALLLERGRTTLELGAGARGGLMQLGGEPSDAQSTAAADFDAWFVGPALFAGASVELGAHVILALELELAYAAPRIRADVEGGGARTLSAWRSSAVLGVGAAW